jgi:hypothetical protein
MLGLPLNYEKLTNFQKSFIKPQLSAKKKNYIMQSYGAGLESQSKMWDSVCRGKC